jgi:hypothetical protein
MANCAEVCAGSTKSSARQTRRCDCDVKAHLHRSDKKVAMAACYSTWCSVVQRRTQSYNIHGCDALVTVAQNWNMDRGCGLRCCSSLQRFRAAHGSLRSFYATNCSVERPSNASHHNTATNQHWPCDTEAPAAILTGTAQFWQHWCVTTTADIPSCQTWCVTLP